jgi:hypothetical protein
MVGGYWIWFWGRGRLRARTLASHGRQEFDWLMPGRNRGLTKMEREDRLQWNWSRGFWTLTWMSDS